MLKLFEFAPVNGKTISPFCKKLEIYCQLANIAYEPVIILPNKAPRGKLPFISDNGHEVSDSGLIIEYLKQSYGDPLDHALSGRQHALGHLLRRTCEDSLLFTMMYFFWLDEDVWPRFRQTVFAGLPPVVGTIVPSLIRRNIRKTLNAEGHGRYSREEIQALGADDLSAIATFLSQSDFAVHDRPTSYDATVFSFLSIILEGIVDTPLKTEALKHKVLSEYLDRMNRELASREKS